MEVMLECLNDQDYKITKTNYVINLQKNAD